MCLWTCPQSLTYFIFDQLFLYKSRCVLCIFVSNGSSAVLLNWVNRNAVLSYFLFYFKALSPCALDTPRWRRKNTRFSLDVIYLCVLIRNETNPNSRWQGICDALNCDIIERTRTAENHANRVLLLLSIRMRWNKKKTKYTHTYIRTPVRESRFIEWHIE